MTQEARRYIIKVVLVTSALGAVAFLILDPMSASVSTVLIFIAGVIFEH